MRVFAIAAVCLLVVVVQVSEFTLARPDSFAQEWSLFKRQHGKSYATQEEEASRFANFMASKKHIERHNANPNNSYKMGLSHMSDWSKDELERMTGLKMDPSMLKKELSVEGEAELEMIMGEFHLDQVPEEVDWRQVPNRVSPVKNQRQCGSCWAFATTGLLEGQQVVRNFTKKLIPLSEQELLDCSLSDMGCNGGIMTNALQDIHLAGGITSEFVYPYLGHEMGTCKFHKYNSIMQVKEPMLLAGYSEEKLKRVVASYGPVAIGLWATTNLMHYKSGVLDDVSCKHVTSINHAVLLVGYGTDAKFGDYWLVKNSWDTTWGEQGYFRIKRGVNMCALKTVPTIASF